MIGHGTGRHRRERRHHRARLRRAPPRGRVRRGGPRRDRTRRRPVEGRGARRRRAATSRTSRPSAWRRVRERLRPTTHYADLAQVDAVVIAVPTPLNENREPDLQPLISAGAALARVLREGQLVVLESTTYPGTTRDRLAPLLEESGLHAGATFNLAFSPERIDPGRTDYTIRTTPEGRRRADAALPRAGERALPDGLRRGRAGLDARGRRAHEAAREHLPLGQHRARQRDRDALRPHGHRRLGGRRRGGHQAVRLHVVQARARAWAATACRSTPSTCRGRRASTTRRPRSSSSPARSTPRCRTSASRRSPARSTTTRKPVKRLARSAILGVSYKAGVGDVRESPAIKIMRLLAERGAELAYHDPYVPELPGLRAGLAVARRGARRRHRRRRHGPSRARRRPRARRGEPRRRLPRRDQRPHRRPGRPAVAERHFRPVADREPHARSAAKLRVDRAPRPMTLLSRAGRRRAAARRLVSTIECSIWDPSMRRRRRSTCTARRSVREPRARADDRGPAHERVLEPRASGGRTPGPGTRTTGTPALGERGIASSMRRLPSSSVPGRRGTAGSRRSAARGPGRRARARRPPGRRRPRRASSIATARCAEQVAAVERRPPGAARAAPASLRAIASRRSSANAAMCGWMCSRCRASPADEHRLVAQEVTRGVQRAGDAGLRLPARRSGRPAPNREPSPTAS